MMWLALAYYAAAATPIWLQDGPAVDDAWFCQVVAVLPGAVIVRIDNDGAPYLVTIPLREVRAIRERYPAGDRGILKATHGRTDDPREGVPKP